jgi:hypothetical protein
MYSNSNSDSDSDSVNSSERGRTSSDSGETVLEEDIDVVTVVFETDALNDLIYEFVGDDDEVSSDGSDSQNFDPEERYRDTIRFFDRHGRFRDSDESNESDEEYYSGDNEYNPEEDYYRSD